MILWDRNLGRAQLASSQLGSLMWFQSDVGWELPYLKVQWARFTRLAILRGSSPLHLHVSSQDRQTSPMATGFPMEWPFQEDQVEAAWPFLTKPWKSHCIISVILNWMTTSQVLSNSRGGNIESLSLNDRTVRIFGGQILKHHIYTL